MPNYVYKIVIPLIVLMIAGGFFLLSNRGANQGVSMPENNLKITDIRLGTGEEAHPGDLLTVNYAGTLSDGRKFDSSYDRGTPFSFVLGTGQVIRGWDEGMAGMKIGGKRRLVIPPELGYGSANVGNGLIPPNSTLIFEVELLKIEKP